MREDLREYRRVLASCFDADRHREKLTLSDFLLTSCGKDWESKGSLLLILFGRNEVGISTVSHSWLSPVAVDLVESLLDSGHTVVYEICTKSSTLIGLMSRLIYQLLEKNPSVIRQAEDFQHIESKVSLSGTRSDKVKALGKALLHIINLHQNQVSIVLNRPELCEEGSPVEYIESMLSLVKDAKTHLKIMIVQRSEMWDVEENEIDTQGVHLTMFRKVRLDQRRQ
jgi:hypothetical protein